jgi:uncharacterized membrane protein YphA (DoxX/SURF4 family)
MYGLIFPWLHLASRLVFVWLFLNSGWSHFTRTDMIAQYAAAKKIPAPRLAVQVSGVMLIVGSVLILLGWHRFIGAGLLFIFLLAAAFLVHNYWTIADPAARAGDRSHFLKDLSLAGAALYFAATAGHFWPLSLGG